MKTIFRVSLLMIFLSLLAWGTWQAYHLSVLPNLERLSENAAQGDWKSQQALFYCYALDVGDEHGQKQADYWASELKQSYKRALKQNNLNDALKLWEHFLTVELSMGFPYLDDLNWLRAHAEQGNAKAQILMGKYLSRCGNVNEATKWYGDAAKHYLALAEQDNTEAQYALSRMYLEGLGIEKSESKAAQWAKRAAVKGNLAACRMMAFFYQNGIGVSASQSQASYWSEKNKEICEIAAENGDTKAQIQLAYSLHDGTTFSQWRALRWAKRAIELGDAHAVVCWKLIRCGNLPLEYFMETYKGTSENP